MTLHPKRSVPIGGDPAHIGCPECGSDNTIIEEYISEYAPDESDLGILCQDCNHAVTPDELGHRFEPCYILENGGENDID